MADIIMDLEVFQDSSGTFNIYNRSSGNTNEPFSLEIILKHSKGDKILTPELLETNLQWSYKAEEDGWFEFTLKQFTLEDTINPVQTFKKDVVSMLYSYKCLNGILLKTDCKCDMDLDLWIKVYTKLTAIKAAACNCLYSNAQCMIENLQKICKGCQI